MGKKKNKYNEFDIAYVWNDDLKKAWESVLQSWTPEQREQYHKDCEEIAKEVEKQQKDDAFMQEQLTTLLDTLKAGMKLRMISVANMTVEVKSVDREERQFVVKVIESDFDRWKKGKKLTINSVNIVSFDAIMVI